MVGWILFESPSHLGQEAAGWDWVVATKELLGPQQA